MSASKTLLEHLRSRSKVDCDTLNAEVAEQLGPFEDATSNQAIAYFELQEHRHKSLVQRALELSKGQDGDRSPGEAVNIAMILLALQMAPHVKGNIHIQVNPFNSYSTDAIIGNAKYIVNKVKEFNASSTTPSVCVKIPSTWEGLQACRILEQQGIKTLATTLFNMEQAALAAEVGCSYIAPYINELKVHFEPGYKDPDPGFKLAAEAQRYYEGLEKAPRVVPASLTSIKECMAVAGANDITIAPPLLQKLHETPAGPDILTEYPSVFDESDDSSAFDAKFIKYEASFRMAMTRTKGGVNERKLSEAINIFCDFQLKLEDMMREAKS